MGFFFAVGAIGLAIQTIVTLRKGFVYGAYLERIYRADDPNRFRLYRTVQFLLVLALMLMAVLSLGGVL